MKKEIKSREDELIDFALAELEKTFDNLNKGKKPEFSKKLDKLMSELVKSLTKKCQKRKLVNGRKRLLKKLEYSHGYIRI